MKKYPYFLIFAALYPVISLYVLNVSEINLIYIIRPILAALVGMGVIFGLLYTHFAKFPESSYRFHYWIFNILFIWSVI